MSEHPLVWYYVGLAAGFFLAWFWRGSYEAERKK